MQRILPLVLVLFLGSALKAQPDGPVFPDFTVTDIDGQTHHLQSYLDDGKTVIIDVFTTWCSVCAASTGGMEQLYEGIGQGGTGETVILTFERDGNEAGAPGWADQYGVMSPIIANEPDLVSDVWNVSYQPRYFVICPDGSFDQLPPGGIGNNPSPIIDVYEENCASSTVGLTDEQLESLIWVDGQTREGMLTVQSQIVDLDYQVLDLTGRVVSEGRLSEGTQRIGILQNRPGLYLLHLQYEGNALTKRFYVTG